MKNITLFGQKYTRTKINSNYDIEIDALIEEYENINKSISLMGENLPLLFDMLDDRLHPDHDTGVLRLEQLRGEYKLSTDDLRQYSSIDTEGFFSSILDAIIGFFKGIVKFFTGGSSSGGGSAPSAKSLEATEEEIAHEVEDAMVLVNRFVEDNPEEIETGDNLKEELDNIQEYLIKNNKILMNIYVSITSFLEASEYALGINDINRIKIEHTKKYFKLLDSIMSDDSVVFKYDDVEDKLISKKISPDDDNITHLLIGNSSNGVKILTIKAYCLFDTHREITNIKIENVPIELKAIEDVSKLKTMYDSYVETNHDIVKIAHKNKSLMNKVVNSLEKFKTNDKYHESLVDKYSQMTCLDGESVKLTKEKLVTKCVNDIFKDLVMSAGEMLKVEKHITNLDNKIKDIVADYNTKLKRVYEIKKQLKL